VHEGEAEKRGQLKREDEEGDFHVAISFQMNQKRERTSVNQSRGKEEHKVVKSNLGMT